MYNDGIPYLSRTGSSVVEIVIHTEVLACRAYVIVNDLH